MEKNLPNSAIRIIESEKVNHCIPADQLKVVAYNEQDEEVACGYPADEDDLQEIMDNFSNHYHRVETIRIEDQREELFLEEEIIQEQIEQIHATSFRFPQSFAMNVIQPSNIA